MANARRNYVRSTLKEINVTPLVDLTFILLIVFMITAPILQYKVDVSPPEMNANAINDSKNDKVISLDAFGNIYIDDISMNIQEFKNTLNKDYKNSKLTFFVRADEIRPYGEVINLMRIIKNSGINNVSLITQREKK